MFIKMDESSGNVIGYRANGVITAADYDQLVPEVEALVKKAGHIRMLLDMREFKGEKIGAWMRDLRFGLEFHHEIDRMAIVGDKEWEELMAQVAKVFYARNARFFPVNEMDMAWAWLRE